METVKTLKDSIREYGKRPKRSLGQVFLIEQSIQKKIIEAADLVPDDVVVEIGSGTGTLTKTIAGKVGRLFALEIDRELVAYLHASLKGESSVRLICADSLQFDFGRLSRSVGSKVKVIGNLPYSISTPLLFTLLNQRHALKVLVLMLQKEVVQRLTGRPGTKEYGALSIMTQVHMEVSLVGFVPRQCFYPSPRVDSAVLKLTPRGNVRVMPCEEEVFSMVVHAAFSRRRKTLYNALRSHPLISAVQSRLVSLMKSVSIDPQRRGETLSVDEFVSLARGIKEELNAG